MRRLVCCLTAVVLALGLSACGDGSERTSVYPAAGKVLYRGRPAAGVSVVLHPVGGPADAPRPRGEVRLDGTFSLTTYEAGDGAPAGDYRVTLEWWLAGAGDGPPSNRLPPHLGQPERSSLAARVDRAATQIPTIELK